MDISTLTCIICATIVVVMTIWAINQDITPADLEDMLGPNYKKNSK